MSYIRTYSGKNFDILNITEDSIDIESIAHGLSQTCRFSGQCKVFYSVAEHSCRIAMHTFDMLDGTGLSRKEILTQMLWGLLHDASEAYLPDMPSPFKVLPELEGFRKLEDNIMAMVATKFNLPPTMPDIVKECDKRIITNERTQLMDMTLDWNTNPEALNDEDMCPYGLNPIEAAEWFLEIYSQITDELNSCGSCPNKCQE